MKNWIKKLFCKTEQELEIVMPKEEPKPDYAQQWDDLAKLNPVGSTFEYLGTKMLITKITKAYRFYCFGETFWAVGKVTCDYIANGKIETKEFNAELFKQIIKP